MADFAQMIYGTAQNVAQSQGEGLAEGFKTGIELAQKREQLQQQKIKLQQDQEAAERAKWDKVGSMYETYNKMAEGASKKAYGTKYIPATLNVMGISEKMNPAVEDQLMTDPAAGGFIASRIRAGQMNQAELTSSLSDPTKFNQLLIKHGYNSWVDEQSIMNTYQKYSPEFDKAEEAALGRKSSLEVAQAKGVAGDKRGEQIQGRFDQSQKVGLAKEVTKLGIPGLKTSLKEVDQAMFVPIDQWKPGMKIPGLSGAEGVLATERLKGKANKLRGAAISVGNQFIKTRTGTAMSDSEAGRILAEVGLTPTVGEGGTWTGVAWKGGVSEESFVNGMKRVREALKATENVYRNAYGSEVYDSVLKESPAEPGTGLIKMSNGKEYPPAQLQALLQKNPNSPLAAEIKQKLGIK